MGLGSRRAKVAACGVIATLCGTGAGVSWADFTPQGEAENYSKINERATQIESDPGFQALLREKGAEREAEALQILASDGPPNGRNFAGQLCWQHTDGCAGDVRLYDWAANGDGIVKPILFTARNGSTLSGHLWMTAAGPAKRPGIVITNGSVQAPEELYWFAAQTLAKAGFVVMTWDPQGQGYSDTFGEGADSADGFPSQTGEPFYDGTEDALDFFYSSATAPYVPRKSCSSGTDHSPKQVARVKAGLDSAYNPFSQYVDYSRVGVLGHSLGAGAVSYVGQLDPRVKAIVAYDNLSVPAASNMGTTLTCPSGSSQRPATIPITKPALGLAADYSLVPEPYTSQPDPTTKTAGSDAYVKAGVDTGEIIIRGGTHYEFSFIPDPAFGGTFRGMDLASWYTTAWFDKYVKGGDAQADTDLQTNRWRSDAQEAAIDPNGDGNMYSFYYPSSMHIGLDGGGRFDCNDLRPSNCPVKADGRPVPYSFLSAANTKDSVPAGGSSPASAGGSSENTTAPAGSTGVQAASTGVNAPTSTCRDVVPPASTFSKRASSLSRTRLRLAGAASDSTGCSGESGRLVRVLVSVGRAAAHKRCVFLREDGTFGPPVSCLRTPYLPATGTANWSFTYKGRLKPGAYKVFVRGVDAAGNIERKARARNFLALKLR